MISVIIPLYNKEAIIGQSLQSVLSQDYDDFEVIVVNDDSTDRSADIVRSIKDSRVRIIEQENGGPSKARNTGVRNANGEWIVFLDADDELLPHALSIITHEIDKHPNCNFIAFPYYNYNGRGKTLKDFAKDGHVKNPFKRFFFGKIAPRMGSFAISRDLAMNCPFDEAIRRFEDDEMLFKAYRQARMFYSAQPVMISNIAYSSASAARKDISEDFLGHIEFCGKSFWEKMCLYKMFIGERPYYQEQCKKLYPALYRRYDLFIIYKIMSKMMK